MNMSIIYFGLTLSLLCSLVDNYVVADSVSETPHSDTLRLLIIFFRHGARTPTRTYNSDPYKNYKWPDGLGSLTAKGKNQLYELGKQYRKYYGSFIPEEYHDKDVYVRSSDKARCLMSAYTFLAGMFPPTGQQAWHPELAWQPIPVHSLPKELDDIVAGTKDCKVYEDMYYQLLNKTAVDPKLTDLYSFLSERMNDTVSHVADVNFVYSSLLAQWMEGLPLPEWSEEVFPKRLISSYMLSLALLSYNDTMQRLRVGPLIKNLKQHFEDITSKKKDSRKLYIYSGHDVNVVSLWRALSFEELLDPEYGASLAFELHQPDRRDQFFIKVKYRNNTLADPMELRLPQCGVSPCPYHTFITSLDKLIPTNWSQECGNHI